jgi:hypothetical protein
MIAGMCAAEFPGGTTGSLNERMKGESKQLRHAVGS